MRLLKQSTAATYKAGPFVDDEDAITPVTDLTIQKADVRLSKNGGDYAAASSDQGSSDVGAPHDESGEYDVSFDVSDTAVLGRLKMMIQKSGALPVFAEFFVVPANVYESLAGSGKPEVDVVQWRGNTPANLADTDKVPASVQHDALGLSVFDPTEDAVTVETNNDKTGYSLHSDYDDAKTAAQPGDAMALTSGERSALAGVLEAAILSDEDAYAVLQGIADKVLSVLEEDNLTVTAIANATRDAILNRILSGNHDIAGSTGRLLQNADVATSTRAAETGGNVTAIKAKTDQLDFTGTGGALKSESTNMRGTDNALLADNYTSPDNAAIENIENMLDELTQDDDGLQLTAHAVALAPAGGGVGGGSGDATLANQLAILQKLSGQITYNGPVSQSGKIKIVRGDDYLAADGLALEWSSAGWPTLTSATILFSARLERTCHRHIDRVAGSVVTASGTKKIRVELTDTITNDLPIGRYQFDVEAELQSGSIVTLVLGDMIVVEDITRPE